MRSTAIRAMLAFCLVIGISATVACTRDPAVREARFLARGKKLLDEKEYTRAVLEFSNAMKLNPKRAETWYQMALGYLGSGRPKEGIMALRRALEIDPGHTNAQLSLSALMLQSRDRKVLEDAVQRLDEVLSKNTDQPEALDLLAFAEIKLNQPEDAEKHLKQALEHFPGRLKSSAQLAALQYSRKQFDAAEKTLQDAVAKAPQSAEAALALAQLFALEKKAAAAETELRRAITLDPASTTAWLALGAVQAAEGKMDEADQSYQKVASLPKSSLPYAHAAFLLRRGNNDGALQEFAKLAKAAPNDRQAQLRLASVNLLLGKEAEGLRILMEILKRNPKDTDALLLRSRVRLLGGKPLDAEADLQQVLHFQPDSANAHYGLSLAYEATGRGRMREKELTEVVRLRPDLLSARLTLANAELASGHADSALQTLEAAPAAQKTTAAYIAQRNWALFALNRDGDVAAAVAEALKSQSTPDLILQRGILKFKKKDFAGAREDAAAALKMNPAGSGSLNLLMQAYAAQNQTAAGLEAVRAVVKDPKSRPMQVLAGYWLARLGKPEEARAAFAAARSGASGNSQADLAEAAVDVSQGNMAAAKSRLQAVIDKEPQNDTALLTLANIAYGEKDYAGALARFKAVAESRPDNVIAVNATAYLMAMSDPDQALKYGEAALALAPDSPYVQDTVGWIYYRKGLYTRAMSYLQAAVAKEPTTVRQFHLAMTYLKSGEKRRGSELLNAVLAKDPNITKTEQGW